jgi:hypothetical protein
MVVKTRILDCGGRLNNDHWLGRMASHGEKAGQKPNITRHHQSCKTREAAQI